MNTHRLVFAFLALVFLIGTTSADAYVSLAPSYAGASGEVTVTNGFDESSDPDDTYRVWVNFCGETEISKTEVDSFPTTIYFDVPEDLSCAPGTYNTVVMASDMTDTDVNTQPPQQIDQFDMKVEPKGAMDPHVGKYIYAVLDSSEEDDSNDHLHNFFLSNDAHPKWSSISVGQIGVGQINEDWSITPNHYESYNTGIGNISAVNDQIGSLYYSEYTFLCNSPRTTNQPCGILTKPYDDTNKYAYRSGITDDVNTVSGLYSDQNYVPSGSLAVATYPEYYIQTTSGAVEGPNSDPDNSEKRIFVCREGADMLYKSFNTGAGSENYYTSQVIDASKTTSSEELLKCNQNTGEWEPVTECNDGIDNDGDGTVDHDGIGSVSEDIDCNNDPNTETEVSGGAGCEPMVGYATSVSFDVKQAFYDPSDSGAYSPKSSTCKYDSIKATLDYTGQQPEQFNCTDTALGVFAENYDGPTPENARQYCENRLATEGGNYEQDPMPAVQYFIPREGIPLGTEFADSTGFAPNTGFITLHQAEEKYEYLGPHNPNSWDNKNMIDDPYANDEPANYINSWVPANATGVNDDKVVYPGYGSINSDQVFDGGFRGKCKNAGAEWRYTSLGWRCDVGTSFNVEMIVNPYEVDGDLGGKYIGFQINWSQMQKWEQAHPMAPPEGSDGVRKVRIKAMCWHGSNTERPQDLSEVANVSDVVAADRDSKVITKLPERSNPPNNKETWSCVWGMSQEVDLSKIEITDETTLFWDGEEGTHTTPTGEEIGYITEGTNKQRKGFVQVGGGKVLRPAGEDGDMQEWLSQRETSEFSGSELWKDFKRSSSAGQGNRHPWQECVNDGSCGISGQ